MARPRYAAWMAALALLAAGCGEDDSEQFQEGYNAAVGRLSAIDSDLGQVQGGGENDQSNTEIAQEFQRIADTVDETRADLADLTPPERARDELDELLGALDQGSADLRAVADAAEKNDPAAAEEAAQNLAATSGEITDAERALKDAVDD